LLADALRAAAVTSTSAEFFIGLPWQEFVIAINEASKIDKERNRAG